MSLLERPDTDVVSDISVARDGIISPDLEVAVTEDQPRPVGPVLFHLPVPALAQLGGADPSPGSSVSLYSQCSGCPNKIRHTLIHKMKMLSQLVTGIARVAVCH